MSKRHTAPKCAVACDFCRMKKIKCDGNEPCRNCINVEREGDCRYPPIYRRPRRNAREKQKALQDRLNRAEALLQAVGLDSDLQLPAYNGTRLGQRLTSEEESREGDTVLVYAQLPDIHHGSMTTDLNDQYQRLPLPRNEGMHNWQQTASACSRYDNYPTTPLKPPRQESTTQMSLRDVETNMRVATPVVSHRQQDVVSGFERSTLPVAYGIGKRVVGQSDIERLTLPEDRQLHNSATTSHKGEPDIHGPGSYLSICSKDGVKWVTERTGLREFSSSATSLASFIIRSLKLQTRSSSFERVQEPDTQTARKYCQIFFDECIEATLNLFYRPAIEERLNNHFESPEGMDTDPAWYALRNVIYAFGSRTCIHRESTGNSWFEAQTYSWRFFQNAFSVHSDLVYSWSSITAVQSLFAMSLFVEGVGSSKLEYMLVNNALQLARSKGLSVQHSPAANISQEEQQQRSWLFWSIYIYEKHICFRSRRPSAIDDDDIDCAIPKYSLDGNPHKLELFCHMIYQAQISSAVMKDLFSARSRQKTPFAIVKTVQDLEERLQRWRQSLPGYLDPEFPIKASNLPQGVVEDHKMWIYLNYYGTLIAIHSIFSCPWVLPDAGHDQQDSIIREQRDRSIIAAAEAARKIILATRSISVTAAAPAWLTFIYPFIGTLNIFTYLLRFPTLPSVAADIELLDIAVGYFSYLAFATQSHISITFVKELAQWARAATTTTLMPNQTCPSHIPTPSTRNSTLPSSNPQLSYDLGNMESCDFAIDDWTEFFSVT